MSYQQWEPDVELFEQGVDALVKLNLRFMEIALAGLALDAHILYESGKRQIDLRILGFAEVNPIVLATVTHSNGKQSVRSGELIGSKHPEEGLVVPAVIRTNYSPVIQEVGMNNGQGVLPTPRKRLRIA